MAKLIPSLGIFRAMLSASLCGWTQAEHTAPMQALLSTQL